MGGMKVLQYRDKSLDAGKRLRQAGALKVLCRRYQALLIINDDVELALNVEADGVHLGQQDDTLANARQRLGDYALIGISCENSLEKARIAARDGASYLAFGKFSPLVPNPMRKMLSCPFLPRRSSCLICLLLLLVALPCTTPPA